ncbi:Plant UBX domain-containing protein 7 [Raphanus sativus]|uniref:UBX domain-containing protein n=1 Tax=Raphanus sativus TaxID=3726 RepID=A0A6J0KUN9_RAPSA|nr:plant UBX domain-containing protein 7 [Raphanus sativus]KAJ4879321.1 Plant UBX domain-containing protein 7 [Raphanus sativus]
MEGTMLSSSDQQRLVSSFLDIAVGQTSETARQFLEATSWKLEEAIQLFYVGGEVAMLPSATHTHPAFDDPMDAQSWGAAGEAGYERTQNYVDEEVRAPLPVARDTLYSDDLMYYYGAMRLGNTLREPAPLIAFRNFREEPRRPGVWEPDQAAPSASASATETTTSAPRDSLASLFRPPFHLMTHGSFEQAKSTSNSQDKWLLVNLQSTTEFSSHMLNRDTWANGAVSRTIKANFIFWQVYDDTTEGRKVSTYYKLDSVPVILVIDPTTGQKMRMWCGMVQPETLLEDLVPFLEGGPSEHLASLLQKRPRGSFSLIPHSKPKDDDDDEEDELQRALAASLEDNGMIESSDDISPPTPEADVAVTATLLPTYPPLPEEPKGGDRSVQCRVGIRLPNGQRLQRNFLKTDPVQLLWSFCYSQLEELERKKPLKLTQAIPGASKTLEYESNLTLEQSGVANSMISATWE